ncbi:Scr1 family TA system antitoxin-like transcriptional regulator [Nocardiopsis sp. N85]|uniref:Scr1 family TA system antitoxin-like transcriptional regulator n=1 Tax=Nocardiopsis sp. N85 TaxID=3029400 RepID=UPI00237F695A|nr:Scr1 family TA system antitoxin-like transcriptional regulator [Nocardiopsis sp. N85]MDE3724651.1 Scr1 family TA system antitoxin-like transcriptional regulator [Nocardiopsis sp. N85]
MTEPPFPESLARFLELRGLSQKQLAARTASSVASVSRWKNGHSLPKLPMAETLDAVLNAEGKLLSSWRVAASGVAVPEWARTLSGIEEAARTLHIVSPVLVPGYLQCASYATQVFRSGWPLVSDEEIARLTKLRTERLGKLPLLRVTAVFPATALTGFDEKVRREQAQHLLNLIATGRVAVHLVPGGSILLEPASTLLAFRLRSGELAISSDHADGNVIHGNASHGRLQTLVTESLAMALPARHSLAELKDLA